MWRRAGLVWRILLLAAIAGASRERAVAADDLAAVAHDAYIFTFPLYENYRLRYQLIYNPANPRRATVNQFGHRRELSDHTSRAVTTPNADTLYSSAFLDLSQGPLRLEVPEIADRYYSLAFMDAYTDNFAYVGTRTTGRHAGKYLITGPGWSGSPPRGATLISAPTNAVWLLGRFLVTGSQDLPQVHRDQDGLRLSPLDPAAPPPASTGPAPSPDDPWNYFAVVNYALTENPPPAGDKPMVDRIAAIGIGPGRHFDPDRFTEPERQAILAGVAAAKRQIAAAEITGKVVNGWAYPAAGLGNFGTDYVLRAATALKALAALEPVEAIYFSHVGQALDGADRYRMHFATGQLPPVDGFWSLSIYEVMPDKRLFFAANPIGRYAIGDRTPGLTHNPDGSLDLLVQHASPGEALESNWLPTPEGPFALILRAFVPQRALLDGSYAPPPVEQLP
jgi:hypothetical protein